MPWTKANLNKALGITSTSTPNQRKKAWRNYVLKAHPNKGGNLATFQNASAAYNKFYKNNSPAPVYNANFFAQAERNMNEMRRRGTYRVGGPGTHYTGKNALTLNKFVNSALLLEPNKSRNINAFFGGNYNKASIHLQNNGHAQALIRELYKRQGLNVPSVLPVGIVTSKSGRGMMLISSKMFKKPNIANNYFVIKVGRMGLANYSKLYNHVNKISRR